MTTTAAFLQLVLPAEALRDLTNYDGSGSATDTTILGYFATMAEGMFSRLTGLSADVDTAMHQGPVMLCAQYYLEAAKGRDRNLIADAKRLAEDECRGIKKLISVSPQTTSPLTTDVPDETNLYPDMSVKNFTRSPSSIVGDRAKSAEYSPDD